VSVHHSHHAYDSIIAAPSTEVMGGNYQLRVSDLLELADYLRANNVEPDALVYDTTAFQPKAVLGLQVLRRTISPEEESRQ